MRDLVGEAVRFALAGVANTAVGLGVTSVLDLYFHVNPQIANACGYAVGIVLSYVLNRVFVFRRDDGVGTALPKFLAALVIAFVVNQLVLLVAGRILGPAQAMRFAAQATAMGSYTVVNFTLCRLWVFRKPRNLAA